MKKKVLVFPCGTEVGLEVHKSLEFSTHFELYGASSIDDHGMFVYKNYIGGVPYVNDEHFVEELNKIIKKFKIDFVIPAHDSVVLELAKAEKADSLAAKVITSELATCEIARSKAKTYKAFEGLIPTPKIYAAQDLVAADFPIFLKPDVGQGSKGTYKANNLNELHLYLEKDPTLLSLEYLPGKEYTVDCFSSWDGELKFAEARERVRVQNGISVNSKTVKDNRIKDMAAKINQTLNLRGAWFFQVKEAKNGDLTLLEIAPRIAGTMALVRCKGANLVLLSLFEAMGITTEIVENSYELVIDRALENRYRHNLNYQHVYVDFDDLILFNEKLNPQLIAFLFQCFNQNKKLHLITKHKLNIGETLARYRLRDLFDEVISVERDDDKHKYIKEAAAIFIDDSFEERKRVKQARNIPVFDSHMVEALMEKL